MDDCRGNLGEGQLRKGDGNFSIEYSKSQALEDLRDMSRRPVVMNFWISAERETCGQLAIEALGLAEPSQEKED